MSEPASPPAPDNIVSLSRNRQKCPECGKPSGQETRPFCSKRCADVDLGRWLKASYAIPSEEEPDMGYQPPQDGDEV